MLKDVTLGQYFPGDSVVHKLDPRTKLLMVVLYIVALFLAVPYLKGEYFSKPKAVVSQTGEEMTTGGDDNA